MLVFKKVFLVNLILLLISCTNEIDFINTDITGASFGRNFELINYDNEITKLNDFKGKILIIFFGFTNCPDICPTTLIKLKEIIDTYTNRKNHFRVAFITLDPKNDTPIVMKKYLSYFGSSFTGLTGSKEQIEKVISEFKIFRQEVEIDGTDMYTIDHSAGLYVYDKNGKLRLYVKQNYEKSELIKDLNYLL